MAFKLTKSEKADFDALHSTLVGALSRLEGEQDRCNMVVRGGFSSLRDCLADYNEAQNDLKQFVDERSQEWENAISEKSDKWRESDAGLAAQGLVDDWASFSMQLEELKVTDPDETIFDFPDLEIVPSEGVR